MRIAEQETGERTELWMVTVTTWVKAPTAEKAARNLAAALPVLADGLDPMVDAVVGWDLEG